MMRFTVVDKSGTMSFVAPCHALKALAAACCNDPEDHWRLIGLLGEYDAQLQKELSAGLHVFDEHNTETDARAIHTVLDECKAVKSPPFRVVDERTRNLSLEPVRYGLVVFNLPARRIVQVQNSYANLERSDRGRIRVNGEPVRRLYRYQLPESWSIVP
jgi:hypothetical protein